MILFIVITVVIIIYVIRNYFTGSKLIGSLEQSASSLFTYLISTLLNMNICDFSYLY